MNRVFLWIALVLAATFLLCFHLYLQKTRYYIEATAKGTAYKIDRKTGKMWFVVRNKQFRVIEKKAENMQTEAADKLLGKTGSYAALSTLALEAKEAGVSPEKLRAGLKKNGLPDVIIDRLIAETWP